MIIIGIHPYNNLNENGQDFRVFNYKDYKETGKIYCDHIENLKTKDEHIIPDTEKDVVEKVVVDMKNKNDYEDVLVLDDSKYPAIEQQSKDMDYTPYEI